MKTRQLQAVRTLTIASAFWAVITGMGGMLKGGTQAAVTNATTISQPAAMSQPTATAACSRAEDFRTAKCNDMRHFAGEWNQDVVRDQQRAPEIDCDDARNFRTTKCNDIRHFGPMSHTR